MNRNFIELLQVSVGTRDELSRGLTEQRVEQIYRLAESQGLVVFCLVVLNDYRRSRLLSWICSWICLGRRNT